MKNYYRMEVTREVECVQEIAFSGNSDDLKSIKCQNAAMRDNRYYELIGKALRRLVSNQLPAGEYINKSDMAKIKKIMVTFNGVSLVHRFVLRRNRKSSTICYARYFIRF